MAVSAPGDIGSPELSTGDPWLDQVLQGQFKSGGPAAGSGFTGTMQPPPGTSLATTTPPLQGTVEGGSTPGIQLPNPAVMPRLSGPGAFMSGVGALTALPTPTPKQMTERLNNPPLANDPWLVHTLFPSLFGPASKPQNAPAAAAAPSAAAPTTTSTAQAGPGGSPLTGTGYGGVPPSGWGDNQGPKTPLPPFVRGPIPFNMPQRGVPRAPQGYNLGYGGAGPAASAPPAAPSPMFTSIDRPNADIVGGPTRPGYLSASYDPATGSNLGAREPGGPARMGALDLSGLFNRGGQPAPPPAGALANPGWQSAVGAPNMNNAMLGMQLQNAGIPTGRGARAQVPPAGFSNKKFFGNPANWQYPNMPF
jgi:hypothetical protein